MADLLTLLGYGVTIVALSDPTLGGPEDPEPEPDTAMVTGAPPPRSRRRTKGISDA